MEASENIKRLAKSEGFPEVKHVGHWDDYEVFCAFDPDFPYIGLPQYILDHENIEPRWATLEETEDIMRPAS